MIDGLLNQQAGEQNTVRNPDGIPENQNAMEGQPDPKAQDNIDMFLANGTRIVHNKKVSDGFIKRIVGANNPVIAIADATLNVIDRLESSASERGVGTLQPESLAQVANVLMGEIMEMSEIAGLKPLSDDEKYQSFSLAVSKYIDKAVKSGKMSKEELGQMGDRAAQTPEGQKIMQGMGVQGMPSAQGPAQGAPIQGALSAPAAQGAPVPEGRM